VTATSWLHELNRPSRGAAEHTSQTRMSIALPSVPLLHLSNPTVVNKSGIYRPLDSDPGNGVLDSKLMWLQLYVDQWETCSGAWTEIYEARSRRFILQHWIVGFIYMVCIELIYQYFFGTSKRNGNKWCEKVTVRRLGLIPRNFALQKCKSIVDGRVQIWSMKWIVESKSKTVLVLHVGERSVGGISTWQRLHST
jgi:hypothetical protein